MIAERYSTARNTVAPTVWLVTAERETPVSAIPIKPSPAKTPTIPGFRNSRFALIFTSGFSSLMPCVQYKRLNTARYTPTYSVPLCESLSAAITGREKKPQLV